MTDRLVLSVSEAADALGVSEWLVYRLIARGELPSVKLGERRLVVPCHELDAYLTRESRKRRRAS